MPNKCEECGDWYREKMMEKVQVKCAVCNIANHGCKPNSVKAWLCGECVNFMIDTENNIVKKRGRSILDIVRVDLVENTKDLIGIIQITNIGRTWIDGRRRLLPSDTATQDTPDLPAQGSLL